MAMPSQCGLGVAAAIIARATLPATIQEAPKVNTEALSLGFLSKARPACLALAEKAYAWV